MTSTRVTNANNRDNPDYNVYGFAGPGDTVIQALALTDSEGHALDGPYINYIEVASATVEYYGKAAPGTATSAAAWQIIKKTVSGTVTSYLFADGDADFDNVWDSRAGLSYS